MKLVNDKIGEGNYFECANYTLKLITETRNFLFDKLGQTTAFGADKRCEELITKTPALIDRFNGCKRNLISIYGCLETLE